MGHIDVSAVEYSLSDGRVLLNDVSFRVGDGAKLLERAAKTVARREEESN